jgi:hypothetical protein
MITIAAAQAELRRKLPHKDVTLTAETFAGTPTWRVWTHGGNTGNAFIPPMFMQPFMNDIVIPLTERAS